MAQERTGTRAKPEDARDYSLVGDAHWRTSLSTALRILAWRSSAPPAPAGILMDALRHIEAMPVAEFNRLASLFDLSKKARKGAVRARTPETRTAEAIAKRLWLDGGGQGEPSERIVVIVALYAYSLHVMAESQLDLFRRVTAYLRRAFKDPTKKTRALTEAGLTAAEAEAALKAAPTRALAAASGRQFVELTRMIDGVGAVSFQVVHAATVAPSDDEFFAMVDREQPALA